MIQIIHSHQILDPSHFENGFSLTSLISSLFHFDDDISKYEHVESDSSSSNTNDDKMQRIQLLQMKIVLNHHSNTQQSMHHLKTHLTSQIVIPHHQINLRY